MFWLFRRPQHFVAQLNLFNRLFAQKHSAPADPVIAPEPTLDVSTNSLIKNNIHGQHNVIIHGEATLNQVEFNIFGDNNSIIIHRDAVLNNVSFNLYGDFHRIEIGPRCVFNNRASIWAEDDHCVIRIGADSSFEGVHLSATEPNSRLEIGEDCMFSYDIDVRTGDSHSIYGADGVRRNYAQNIAFGNHVWVASHCIFTKGAQVGSHSIVGTGSLVNKPFKQESVIIAGNPAKIIDRNISWSRERVYQANESRQKINRPEFTVLDTSPSIVQTIAKSA